MFSIIRIYADVAFAATSQDEKRPACRGRLMKRKRA
jgi:hypothetical protein